MDDKRIKFQDDHDIDPVIFTFPPDDHDEIRISIPRSPIPGDLQSPRSPRNGDLRSPRNDSGYYTIVEKRGKLYNEKSNLPYALTFAQSMGKDLHDDADRLSRHAYWKAVICKYLHLLLIMFVIAGNITITIVSIKTNMTPREYIIAIFSAILASVVVVQHLLKLGARSSRYKHLHLKFRSVVRSVSALLTKDLDADSLYRQVHHYYSKLDRYHIRYYNNSLLKYNSNSSFVHSHDRSS